LSDIGDRIEDQKALRNVLLEYSEVFSPTTETVPGVQYKIILKPGADILSLNRPVFRKAPKEMEQERKRWKGYWKGG
jgi:hypothetical protein